MNVARSDRNRRLLALAAILLLGSASPVAPSTIVVSGSCTLARAIEAANDDDDGGGLCPRVDSRNDADTLILTSDVTLSAPNTTAYGSSTGLPLVTSDVAIVGGGFTVERAPTAPPFRIFAVAEGGALTLHDVTVRGGISAQRGGGIVSYGTLRVVGSRIQDNHAATLGGGIGNAGILRMTNSTVSYNSGRYAIFDDLDSTELTMDHCIVADNHDAGLGTDSDYAPTRVTNSSFLRNAGDGIRQFYAGTYFANVTIADNEGRGIFVGFGSLARLDSSTIHGNAGGGIQVQEWSRFRLTNSTISGHTTDSLGAAILDDGGGSITSSTIVGNTSTAANGAGIYGRYTYHSSALLIRDTIVAGNEPRDCFFDEPNRGSCDTLPPITPGVDVVMELADNGGPTLTHALPPGSAAIDAGVLCEVDVDQRGVPRDDGACDLGAYELVAPVACEVCTPGELLVGRIEDLRVDRGCARAECAALPPGMDPLEYLLTLPPGEPGDGYFYLE